MAQVGCRDSADRRGAVRSPLGRHALGALDDRPVGGPAARRGEAGGADAGPVEIRRLAGVRGVVGAVAYAASQLLLIAVLYGAYSFSRHLAAGREPAALANAKSVWRLERILRLPSEASAQHLALHSQVLIRSADWFYILVHFPSVIALLLWVFIRHRRHWTRVRNVLILTTGIALVIHLLYPLAPPRFLPSVLHIPLVDTGARYGPSPYGEGSGGIANEYAAMPSLHVGWSLIEAWAIITILRHRVRWLAVLHPVLTITVVVITANHYWLDGVVGSSLVVVSIVLLNQANRRWAARGAARPAAAPPAAPGGSGAGPAARPAGIPAARDGAPSRPGARVPPSVPAPTEPADEPSRR
ncbi:phosphatase PAP2 family protein [Frankia sp. AgKG'84/4]